MITSYCKYGDEFIHIILPWDSLSLNRPPVFPPLCGLRSLKTVVITNVAFILVGLFPGSHGLYIKWSQWDGGSLSAYTGIKFIMFTLHSLCPWVPKCVNVLCYLKSILHTHPSMDKYFSTQNRPFSTPALVQRYMDTSMPKNKAGSLGRSFILSCGGQGFISPVRELPRSVKQNDSSTECCLHFMKFKSRLLHGLFVA